MPNHLFAPLTAFANGFAAEHALLSRTPYAPEVLIIGTFNPAPQAELYNPADFFYGRNYFWPAWGHLGGHADHDGNAVAEGGMRRHRLDRLPLSASGPWPGVLGLCTQFRLTFADLVESIDAPVRDFSDRQVDAFLRAGQAKPNTQTILNYLEATPSIRFVYATTRFQQVPALLTAWQAVVRGLRPGIQSGHLLTPSGQGVGANFPGMSRTATLAHHWRHQNSAHGDAHSTALLLRPGFTRLDADWLHSRVHG
jgi:hypothetical protein